MKDLLGRKKNGGNQSMEYVDNIVNEIVNAACSQGEVKDDMCPFWHFNTRKAIELWPREVYRHKMGYYELFFINVMHSI